MPSRSALTPKQRAALLADVAAILTQALAAEPTKRSRWVGRTAQIREIAEDDRIRSRARHTQRALIDEVMSRYHVSYANARVMISRAREYLREDKAQ